jgi:hypothetical protein
MSVTPRDLITARVTRWKTRCEIWKWNPAGVDNPGYETIWKSNVPVVDGSVSISWDRPENRYLDITLSNIDGDLTPNINGMWYDKFIVLYKQLLNPNGTLAYELPLGHFMLDGFKAGGFPHLLTATGRDLTKKLLGGRFGTTKTYFKGSSFEDAFREICRWGGVPQAKILTPLPSWNLKRRITFERGDLTYYDALVQLIKMHSISGYPMFNAWGDLRIRRQRDIILDDPIARFDVGPGGNLVSFDKSADDTRIFNHIIVINEGSNQQPMVGRAWNNDSSHPTSRPRIGERADVVRTSSLQSVAECEEFATELLSVAGLESFNVEFDSLVMPWPDLINQNPGGPPVGDPANRAWLDVNNVLEFYDGTSTDYFSLTDLEIPLGLGTMSGTMKRISLVPWSIP